MDGMILSVGWLRTQETEKSCQDVQRLQFSGIDGSNRDGLCSLDITLLAHASELQKERESRVHCSDVSISYDIR